MEIIIRHTTNIIETVNKNLMKACKGATKELIKDEFKEMNNKQQS